jgi:hypothetical protein
MVVWEGARGTDNCSASGTDHYTNKYHLLISTII